MEKIKQKLIIIQSEDQVAIHQPNFKSVSEKHVEELKKMINQIGWPTISKVGKKASFAAWLIAQHADQDPKFQKYCLNLMLSVKNDVEKKNIAYLTDRILVHQNKPQLYGTQFYIDELGNFRPRPIEDLEHIENRWREMEMAGELWKTFEEYKQYMENKQKQNR